MRLFIACTAIFLFQVASQPPSPTPGKHGQEKQQSSSSEAGKNNTAHDSSGAPPPNIQVVTNTAEKTCDKEDKKSSTDWWLTLFTGALAVVAILQFWAMHKQARHMRDGLRVSIISARATRRAANAARTSADSLKAIERPWLLINSVDHLTGMFKQKNGRYDVTHYATWRFSNHGKTPARILEVGGNLLQIPNLDALPPEPVYKVAPNYTDYTVLAPDRTSSPVEIPEPEFNSDQVNAALRGLNVVLVSGFVKYSDPWDGQHETRFAYLWEHLTGQFSQIIGPAAYNRHT